MLYKEQLFHNLDAVNDLMDLIIFHPSAFHRLASTKPFPDSKTLVDLVLKPHLKPESALKRVEALGPVLQDKEEERRAVQALLDDCFDPPGTELSSAPLLGFDPSGPSFLHSPNGPYPSEVRAFALHVHSLWPHLCRVAQRPAAAPADADAADSQSETSPIPPDSFGPYPGTTFLSTTHPVIVPGDRFREVYYWDSYWIIKGLLRSGLPGTAEGMVRNFLGAARRFGYVPNGGRSYYLNRSQPPLLSQMVKEVAEALDAPRRRALLEEALPALLIEHKYWTSGPKLLRLSPPPSAPRIDDNNTAELSRYYASWDRPRPESYMEDYELAGRVAGVSPRAPLSDKPGCSDAAAQQDRRQSRLWRDVASAAESGWDFSTRWFEDGRRLESIRTTGVVPADLNGFLFQMERNIAGFAQELGDPVLASDFEGRAARRRDAMNTLMWDHEGGMWRDLWLERDVEAGAADAAGGGPILISSSEYRQHKGGTFASSFVPLWCGLASSDPPLFAAAVAGLERSGLLQPGGLVTSAAPGDPAQQWEYPNGWAPLQSMIIDALCSGSGGELSVREKGLALARRIACGWLNSCRDGLRASGGFLAEKYDVVSGAGTAGGGGEYAPQVGFGWTNGVVLDFLARRELWGWDGRAFRP